MGKTSYLSAFEQGMVVETRRTGVTGVTLQSPDTKMRITVTDTELLMSTTPEVRSTKEIVCDCWLTFANILDMGILCL